jgi:hypothetical protein
VKGALAKLKRSISATTPPPCADCMQRYRCGVEELACYDFAKYTQSTHELPRLKERRLATKWIYDHIFSHDGLYEISDHERIPKVEVAPSALATGSDTADAHQAKANTLGRDARSLKLPRLAKATPLAGTPGPSYSETPCD